MAEWIVNGFKITIYQADHPPLHCHVRKDGKFVGKYNLEPGSGRLDDRPLSPQKAGECGHRKMEARQWNLTNLVSSTSACRATAR